MWEVYQVSAKTRQTWKLRAIQQAEQIDTIGCIPCDFITSVVGIRPPVYAKREVEVPSRVVHETWDDFVQSLPKWEYELLKINEDCAEGKLLEEITRRTGKLFLVTDGGAADVYSSYGWVVATKDKVLWKG